MDGPNGLEELFAATTLGPYSKTNALPGVTSEEPPRSDWLSTLVEK